MFANHRAREIFVINVAVEDGAPPADVELMAPSPNPFRAGTRLRYRLASRTTVALRVYDVGGRLVRTLEAGAREAGEHAVAWDGRDESGRPVASGLLFARLSVEGRETARALVKVR